MSSSETHFVYMHDCVTSGVCCFRLPAGAHQHWFSSCADMCKLDRISLLPHIQLLIQCKDWMSS